MEHLSVSHIMKSTEIQRGKIVRASAFKELVFSLQRAPFILYYFAWLKCEGSAPPLPCPAYRMALQVIVAKVGNCSAEAPEGIMASWDPGKFYFPYPQVSFSSHPGIASLHSYTEHCHDPNYPTINNQ